MKLDCVHGVRSVHVKHESKSIEMFEHWRYMKSEGIQCHCDICEYSIRLMRAVDNKDPYLSVKTISLSRRNLSSVRGKRLKHRSTLDANGNFKHCDNDSCSYCNSEYNLSQYDSKSSVRGK
jgi:hypothetical protein